MKAAKPTDAFPAVFFSSLFEAASHFTHAASENTPLMQSRRCCARTCARMHMRVSLHSLQEHLIEQSEVQPLHPWLAALCCSLKISFFYLFIFFLHSTKGIYVSCRVCCGLRLEHNWLNMNAYFSLLESRSSPTSISLRQFCLSFFPGGIGKEMSARGRNVKSTICEAQTTCKDFF